MKKSIHLLLVLPLLLGGCNDNSSSNSSNNASVDNGISTHESLKGVLKSYQEKGVSKLVTLSTTKTSSTEREYKFRSHEIYTHTIVKDNNNSVTSNEIDYFGYVDGYKYSVSDTFSERIKVYADGEEHKDELQENEMLSQLNEKMTPRVDLTEGIWKDFFKELKVQSYGEEGTKVISYSLEQGEATITVKSKAESKTYSGIDDKKFSGIYKYTFVAKFNYELELQEGSLSYEYFNVASCDENQQPLSSASALSKGTEQVQSITIGNLENTGKTPMIDVSSYYMTSLKDSVYIKSSVTDDNAGQNVMSNKNEVFAGTVIANKNIYLIDYNDNYDVVARHYLPETALDFGDVRVTNSSSAAIYLEGNECKISMDEQYLNSKVTLTLGNDYINNLGTVEVTIVANPFETHQGGTGNMPELDTDKIYFLGDDNGSSFSFYGITIKEATTSYLVIEATNDGPYDDYTSLYSVLIGDETIVQAEIDYEYGKTNNIKGIVIKITGVSKGYTSFIFQEKDAGENWIIGVYLTVE